MKPLLRNFPDDQTTLGEIDRHQRLPHPADRPSAQHRLDALNHLVHMNAAQAGNLSQRIDLKALDAILGEGEDAGIDRIANVDGAGDGVHIEDRKRSEVRKPGGNIWAAGSGDAVNSFNEMLSRAFATSPPSHAIQRSSPCPVDEE